MGQYRIPKDSKPGGLGSVHRFNLADKYRRGVGFNYDEQSRLLHICEFGPEQIIGCYGEMLAKCEDAEVSAADIVEMCQGCPHLRNQRNLYDPMKRDISLPYFIEQYRMLKGMFPDDEKRPKAYVYFIYDGQFIKIGKAVDPKKRLTELAVGNPHPLELIFLIPTKTEAQSLQLEMFLHSVYQDYRKSGEWFDIARMLQVQAWIDMYGVKA